MIRDAVTPTPSRISSTVPVSRWCFLMVAAASLGLLDQAVKAMISTHLPAGERIAVTAWLNLVHTYNPGAAFSLLANAGGWQFHLLSTVGVGVIVILSSWLWRSDNGCLEVAAYVGLIGGALGNTLDRIRLTAVIDYLDLHWRGLHWPAFNLADVFIVGSAALLVFASFWPANSIRSPGV